MAIHKLPMLLVNQIAAGEVIERPASVVKELVENSLDAQATQIDITIVEGGRQLIRISDNGLGITGDDLPLAIEPHATSKIASADDLAAIGTLGFRGEALASMASISRLKITSKACRAGQLSEAGYVIAVQGDQVADVQPIGCAQGTVIEVRDLFFNVPARRKFMRAPTTEFGHISDSVTRVAMGWPTVGFSLTHNGRVTLQLLPNQTRKQRCVQLLGKELADALIEIDEQVVLEDGGTSGGVGTGGAVGKPGAGGEPGAGFVSLWGLAGHPSIARSTTKHMYLCLNGRPIRDRNLMHAMREAYRGLLPHDRQPIAVICLEVDAQAMDVNVHPTKAQVRFAEPGRFHGMVLAAIRKRLLASDLTTGVDLSAGKQAADPANIVAHSTWPGPSAGRHLTDSSSPASAGTAPAPGLPPGFGPPGGLPSLANLPSAGEADTLVLDHGNPDASDGDPSAQAFVDYIKRLAPKQKGFVYQQVKQALASEAPELLDDDLGQSDLHVPGAEHLPPKIPTATPAVSVLQVHKSYLVTEDEQGLLIVDQHALHERVMFEQLAKRVLGKRGNLESQRLLMPVTLRASAGRMALLETLGPLLERMGIEAGAMGPDTIAIHAFASFLFDRQVDPADFLDELLDKVEAGDIRVDTAQTDHVDEAVLHKVLDMMACKAAVKAGDHLSDQELGQLLAQRDQIERSSNCPHGRPTAIRLTIHDLEKHFQRT